MNPLPFASLILFFFVCGVSPAEEKLCNQPRWNNKLSNAPSIPIKVSLSPPIFNKANSPRMSVFWDTRLLFDSDKDLCDYQMNVLIILKTGQKYNLCLTSTSGCTRGLPEGLCEAGESELRLAIELPDKFQWEAPFGKTLREIPCSLDRKLDIVDYNHGNHPIQKGEDGSKDLKGITTEKTLEIITVKTPMKESNATDDLLLLSTLLTSTVSTTRSTTPRTTSTTVAPATRRLTTSSKATTVSTTDAPVVSSSSSTTTKATTTTTTASVVIPKNPARIPPPTKPLASCQDAFPAWNQSVSISISEDTLFAKWSEMVCQVSEYILEIRAQKQEAQNVVSSQKFSPASVDPKDGFIKAEIPLSALSACKNFTYVLRAIESQNNVSVKHSGDFSSPCPNTSEVDETTEGTAYQGWPTQQPDPDPTPKASANLDSGGSNSGSKFGMGASIILCSCFSLLRTL